MPSGPMTVGTYGSPTPGPSVTHSDQRISDQVPAIGAAVFAGRENAVSGGVHCGGIDAPFAHSQGKTGRAVLHIRGGADHGQHFTHDQHAVRRRMCIHLGGIRIKQGDAVHAIRAVASGIGVVIVFTEDQIT